MTLGAGQFCTQPGLIFVSQNDRTERFLHELTQLVSSTPPSTLLTPHIQANYTQALARHQRISGVRLRARGQGPAGAALLVTDARTFLETPQLQEEIFGPASLVVVCPSLEDFTACAKALAGQLTATVWATPKELDGEGELLWTLEQKAGRIIFNGFPTGVEVGTAMVHGGPFPAATDSRFSSVGTRSIQRFVRPIAWQTRL
jgi:NADP-dependent aldehyde dehydrogenase